MHKMMRNFPGRLEETKAEVFPKLMAESFQILFFFHVKRTGKIGLRRLPNAVERISLIPSSHASHELVTTESSLPRRLGHVKLKRLLAPETTPGLELITSESSLP